MKKKDLFKQLNNLKNQIKPDLQWQERNREILLNQISAQTNTEKEVGSFRFISHMLSRNFLLPIIKPMAGIVVIVAAVFVAWSASVSATKNSLPGEFFYNVKLTSERVKVNLALGDEKKANLEIEYAERRLDEINKLSDKGEKGSALDVPLKKYQENMVNVKSNLAKLEKTDKQAALKIADKVDQKTKEYVGLLTQKQGENPLIASNAEAAITTSKKIAEKALDMIIEEYVSGNSEFNQDQIREKVMARVDTLRTEFNQAKTDIDKIAANQKAEADQIAAEAAKKAEEEKALAEAEAKAAAEAAKVEEAKQPEAATSVEPTPVASETPIPSPSETPSPTPEPTATPVSGSLPAEPEKILTNDEALAKRLEAMTMLADAENLLSENKIKEAFTKIKDADEIYNNIKKVVLANAKYLEDAKPETEATPAEGEGESTEAKSENEAE